MGPKGGFKYLGPPLLCSRDLPQTQILRSSGMQAPEVNATGKPRKLTAPSLRKTAERDKGRQRKGE